MTLHENRNGSMEEEFPDTEIQQTIRVMFRDLKDSEKASIRRNFPKFLM